MLAFSTVLAGCYSKQTSFDVCTARDLACAEIRNPECPKPDSDADVDADAEVDADIDADLDGIAPASPGAWTAVVTEVSCPNEDGRLSQVEILFSPDGNPSLAGADLRLRCCGAAGSACFESPLAKDRTGTAERDVFTLSAPFAPQTGQSDGGAEALSCHVTVHGLVVDSFALWDSKGACEPGKSWQLAPGWENPEANDASDNWCVNTPSLGDAPGEGACGDFAVTSLDPVWGHDDGGEIVTIGGVGFPPSGVEVLFCKPGDLPSECARPATQTVVNQKVIAVQAPWHVGDSGLAGGAVEVHVRSGESQAVPRTFHYAGEMAPPRGENDMATGVFCGSYFEGPTYEDRTVTEVEDAAVECEVYYNSVDSDNYSVQVGFGPLGTVANNSPGWVWADAASVGSRGNNQVWSASAKPPTPGSYAVVCRVGFSWTKTEELDHEFVYCIADQSGTRQGPRYECKGLDPLPTRPFDPTKTLRLTVK